MGPLATGLIVALVAWWSSTGVILWLVRRPERTFGTSLAVGTVLAAAALVALMISARDDSVTGAYVGFGAALTIWGWHELAFLTGKLTGTVSHATPPAAGWARFRAAAGTLMHHEVALALTGVLVLALTWGGSNPTGLLTFALLFGMRLSTKLNIYLGVANPPSTFLPARLAHLEAYFRRARFNALFPFSLAAAAAVTALLVIEALDPATGRGLATGFALMTGLSALGLIEHGFLMMPSPDRALWGWALGPQDKTTQSALAAAGDRKPRPTIRRRSLGRVP